MDDLKVGQRAEAFNDDGYTQKGVIAEVAHGAFISYIYIEIDPIWRTLAMSHEGKTGAWFDARMVQPERVEIIHRCPKCNRSSSAAQDGDFCNMTQPSGIICDGVFKSEVAL